MSAIDAENANADEFDLLQNCRKYPVFRCHRQLKIFWMQKVLHDLECDADKMKETVKRDSERIEEK